jgi:hypothetical protein
MRMLGILVVALLSACGAPQMGPEPTRPSTTPPVTIVSPASAEGRERAYLDGLRAASVPLSRNGDTEVRIGRGICAEVTKGADPEALADDLLRAVPSWTSDNVTAVVRTALVTLC